jgi:hypothetical protein
VRVQESCYIIGHGIAVVRIYNVIEDLGKYPVDRRKVLKVVKMYYAQPCVV